MKQHLLVSCHMPFCDITPKLLNLNMQVEDFHNWKVLPVKRLLALDVMCSLNPA